jgi:hypothetical protein
MRQILAVIVGVMLTGIVAGVVIPLAPSSIRGPWLIWGIAALTIAVCLYVADRTKETPPD